MQTKTESLIEALTNTFIGFWINYCANLVILPLFFGITVGLGTNFAMGLVYTGISVARSYVIRRWFNARLHRFAHRAAQYFGG